MLKQVSDRGLFNERRNITPAIRSSVGDWTFYVTTLTFYEVGKLIKSPDEIHPRKRLSEWIQRVAIKKHSKEIAEYILTNEQRFLGALIVGVYGGNPNWAPLNLNFSNNNILGSSEQKEKVEGKLGILSLNGQEKLFAIDGQHRVEGIKKALEDQSELKIHDNEISALFVGHNPESAEGQKRTRRLFTTVNKKAKRISTAARIALDEDDGFAITTRNLIDKHWLFEDDRRHISYTSSGAIQSSDKDAITSVVGLFQILKDLYFMDLSKREFQSKRPSDADLHAFLEICLEYWDCLLLNIDEYDEVFKQKSRKATYYRQDNNNHLLFRPVGQRVFTKCVQLLMSRGLSCSESVKKLLAAPMYINEPEWHHFLWNPIKKSMITNNLTLSETQLLSLAKQKPRNQGSDDKLKEFLDSIQSNLDT